MLAINVSIPDLKIARLVQSPRQSIQLCHIIAFDKSYNDSLCSSWFATRYQTNQVQTRYHITCKDLRCAKMLGSQCSP